MQKDLDLCDFAQGERRTNRLSMDRLPSRVAMKLHKCIQIRNVSREGSDFHGFQWTLCYALIELCVFIANKLLYSYLERWQKQDEDAHIDTASSETTGMFMAIKRQGSILQAT